MFEIWRHVPSGQRYLVLVRDGWVNVAAGPLRDDDDPRRVLETHGNQRHNPLALLQMRRSPQEFTREYILDGGGHAIAVPP